MGAAGVHGSHPNPEHADWQPSGQFGPVPLHTTPGGTGRANSNEKKPHALVLGYTPGPSAVTCIIPSISQSLVCGGSVAATEVVPPLLT